MYQLRNAINRTLVPADPEKNMNAAEDYMLLLLHAYIMYAGKRRGQDTAVLEISLDCF